MTATETGTVTVVPSVHFSPTHRRRVREMILEREPDVVAVELDERRYQRLERRGGDGFANVYEELPPPTALVYATLQAIQRTIVRLYGLDPGETEMETAIETAAETETDVALVDEPITETMTALSRAVGVDTIPKLMVRSQLLSPHERLAQLEVMTTPFREIEHGDDVEPLIDAMRTLLPEVTSVLIDRRDRAMAERLHRLQNAGHDVVAVVGAGHHNGIERTLAELEATNAELDVDVPIRRPTREVTTIPIE
ncbi:TraB domain-containing protein [Natrialbaceae archaeon AArc-T1-2]|uniref:TraB domain-containing protein n=1 Tax=Natrialbaceae archaeon AArc-T1-2 TaxID=3053904 RepID=UPI00255A826D|nr:TraB domain-containing protein [Natrialbaceae archaeon AArc-T1-2]WIV67718.1 TraB domain-containing protein [Natrialbaceae archaeon AArc-T1-2]